MVTITLSYPLFVVGVSIYAALAFFLCLYAHRARLWQSKHATVTQAFAELFSQSSRREAALLVRALSAESDADRLAPIVAQYLKDIDSTAALLKDETPPSLTAEREALRLHQSNLALRTHETHTEKV